MMHRDFSEQFLKMYESEPCLWLVKSKHYHDRNKKEAAYEKLTEKLKEIEPNATKDSVIKEINNIRSVHRKESKKVKDSMKSGAAGDDVFKPTLWYYSMLSFLGDQDTPRTSRSNLDSDDDGVEEYINSETEQEQPVIETQPSSSGQDNLRNKESSCESSPGTSIAPRSRRRKPETNADAKQKLLATDVLLQVNAHFKKPRVDEDRFDVVGKTVAMKLRGLPKQQMLIAENIINHALFKAEFGRLTLPHRLTSEPIRQQNPLYFCPGYAPAALLSTYPQSPYTSSSCSPSPTSQHSDTFQQQLHLPQTDPDLSQYNQTASSFLSNFDDAA